MRNLPRGPVFVACAAMLAAAARPAPAQVLQGRVLGEADNRPIAAALVQLVDREGGRRTATVADSAGRYRLEAPEPGEFHVVAEGLGYETFRSLLFDLSNPDAVYPVDIGLRPAPLEVAGITVTAERIDQLERSIQLAIGLHPSSLRTKPIMRPEIESHVRRGHNLVDLARWANIAGMIVRTRRSGPCFQLRQRCVPVYLNEWRVPSWVAEAVELDLVETVVVVHPSESIKYEGGALLLYTAAWLR